VVAQLSLALGGATETAFAFSSCLPEPAVSPEQPASTAASTNTMEAVLPTRAILEAVVFIIYPSAWSGREIGLTAPRGVCVGYGGSILLIRGCRIS
jgi:hypothetical protein